MIVRMAVATVESVLRMPHFARMDVRPANSAEPTAYNNHIQIASFSTIVRALPVLCNLLLYNHVLTQKPHPDLCAGCPAHLPTEKLPLSVGLPVGPAHNVVGLAPGIRQQLISSRCSSVVSGSAHSRGSTGCPPSGLPRRCNAHAARRRPYPSPPGRRQTAASRSFPRRYARCSTGRARPRRRGPRAFLAALVARVGHLDGGDDIAHTALCPGIRIAVVEPVIDRECVKHGRHLFCTNKNTPKRNASGYLGAGYESRTRHLLLGKQSLYRMS